MYAAQSYDAANLLDAALSAVKGNVADRDALRAALRTARFQSVRGDFSLESNQFPRAGFYRVDVVRTATGAAFESKNPIVPKSRTPVLQQCKMN
jgi:branched-chain amino acid transport system substrate-binding protein